MHPVFNLEGPVACVQRVSTDCRSLDSLLDGGIEPEAISLVFGEGASGKTNLALQMARVVASAGKRVAFVDTEGVSNTRLQQVFSTVGEDAQERLLFFTPFDIGEQSTMVEKTTLLPDLGLIVVDSINMHYRLHLDGDNGREREASRSLYKQLHHLSVHARRHNIPVLVTGQVYGGDDATQPFARRTMEHVVKSIIRFERTEDGNRRATVLKHRSIEEGRQVPFAIGSTGLVTPAEAKREKREGVASRDANGDPETNGEDSAMGNAGEDARTNGEGSAAGDAGGHMETNGEGRRARVASADVEAVGSQDTEDTGARRSEAEADADGSTVCTEAGSPLDGGPPAGDGLAPSEEASAEVTPMEGGSVGGPVAKGGLGGAAEAGAPDPSEEDRSTGTEPGVDGPTTGTAPRVDGPAAATGEPRSSDNGARSVIEEELAAGDGAQGAPPGEDALRQGTTDTAGGSSRADGSPPVDGSDETGSVGADADPASRDPDADENAFARASELAGDGSGPKRQEDRVDKSVHRAP